MHTFGPASGGLRPDVWGRGNHVGGAQNVFICLIPQVFYDNCWVLHKSGYFCRPKIGYFGCWTTGSFM